MVGESRERDIPIGYCLYSMDCVTQVNYFLFSKIGNRTIFDNAKRAPDDLLSNRVTQKYFVKYIFMRTFVVSILQVLYEHSASLVCCRQLCT